MIQYDPAVIEKFAARLYSKANSIIAVWAILGLVLFAGGAWFAFVGQDTEIRQGLTAALGLFGAFVGFSVGSEKAFLLKLAAQTALCQVQIEKNSRHTQKPL